MSERNLGPYIVGGCVAVAFGLYLLGQAIRDAGNRVGTSASNSTGNVSVRAEGSRYQLQKAEPAIAGGNPNAFWVFDMEQRRVDLIVFKRDEFGFISKNTLLSTGY